MLIAHPGRTETKTTDSRTAIILGASGLVGGECLSRLCASPLYLRVLVVARRDLGSSVEHDKITQIVVDFDRLEEWSDVLVGDDVFCAFGSTIKKAESKDRFQQIDFTYPSTFARIVRRNGAEHLSLVSSIGAKARSRTFYLRVKGELEDAIVDQDWPSVTILRPSVIGGERSESRFAERLGQRLFRHAPASFRTVEATDIARAMLELARQRRNGVQVVESRDIKDRGRRLIRTLHREAGRSGD